MDTAASSSSSQCNYDVFLSFRGEDTRKKFTAHLYAALCRKGIYTFIDDDKLERGQVISPALITAIENSKFSVIVLSENYASSRWCLEELVKILECRKSRGQRVLPIFYNVDPSDVRKQSGKFGEALAQLEENLKDNLGRLKVWKDALSEVANLSGFDSRNYKDEPMLIDEIVTPVLKTLLSISSCDVENLIGIESRIRDMDSLLSIESLDVRMVGICGMAGIGKTTLARAIYNRISSQFQACSFLENIEEDLKNRGLGLQKEVLSQLLDDRNLNINGLTSIKARLHFKKVLIVIDDVSNSEILEVLIGKHDWFGVGSRIIVTTRDQSLLTQVDAIYELKKLNHCDAIKLFSLCAFGKDQLEQGYMDLSYCVIDYAEGLPLALRVLGSLLRDKRKDEWESQLDKLRRIPDKNIYKVLRVSFDRLDHNEKEIFLDIACFFKGYDKDYVMEILKACGFLVDIGIKGLIEKSLITISNSRLMMHNLLREMGREIVFQDSLKEPGKRSRLWIDEDIDHILTKNSGANEVEGIFLDLLSLEEIHFTFKAFEQMDRLRLLKIYKSYCFEFFPSATKKKDCKVYFHEDFKFHSHDLRLLCWHGYAMESLPYDFNSKNLVDLSLPCSHIKQLWKGTKVLKKLKFMDLSHSKYLIETPDFSEIINLERLVLDGCISLLEVHSSLVVLKKLSFLSLKNCKMLKNLPKGMHNMKSLETLDLSGCSNCGELKWLKVLYADKGSLSSTQLLAKRRANSLCFALPPPIGFCSLTKLDLSYCNISDGDNLDNLCFLSSLKDLNLSGNNFDTLPSRINQLSRLRLLNLANCRRLQALLELPSSIEVIHAHNCTSLSRVIASFTLNWKEAPPLPFFELGFVELFKADDVGVLKAAFCLVLPGRGVPHWVRYRNRSWPHRVKVKLPPNWFNANFQGFALSAAAYVRWSERVSKHIGVLCIFDTDDSPYEYEHRYAVRYDSILPGFTATPKHVLLLYIPLPPGINVDRLQRVSAILIESAGSQIIESGLDLVYRNEEVNNNNLTMVRYLIPPFDSEAVCSGYITDQSECFDHNTDEVECSDYKTDELECSDYKTDESECSDYKTDEPECSDYKTDESECSGYKIEEREPCGGDCFDDDLESRHYQDNLMRNEVVNEWEASGSGYDGSESEKSPERNA